MKLLFLSSDPVALPCLRALAANTVEGLELAGVVTNPDRRSGRGKRILRNPVAAEADRLGAPVLQPERPQAETLESFVGFDLALVFAYGRILSRKTLSLRPDRFLNLHASPLPLLRGPSPIETAVAEGYPATEVCLMRMVPRMDAGPVAARLPVPVPAGETGPGLRATIAGESVRLLGSIPAALRGDRRWEPQDESRASWCRMIAKTDALVDFTLSAERIEARARAFAKWPGAAIQAAGETIRIADLSVVPSEGRPGEILEAGERLVVAAGAGALAIRTLQRPTRKPVPWPEFRKARPLREGALLPFTLSRPLVGFARNRD